MKYYVSKIVDCRVDIEVEADSFAEAYKKADDVIYEKDDLEIIGDELGYACCENDTDAEYGCHPYPDEK